MTCILKSLVRYLCLCASLSTAQAAEPEILLPELAFSVAARLDGSARVALDVTAAPGYSIYKDRLSFEVQNSRVRIVAVTYGSSGSITAAPEADARRSHLRGTTSVVLELSGAPTSPVVIGGSVQGCADIGVCLPPLRFQVEATRATEKVLRHDPPSKATS